MILRSNFSALIFSVLSILSCSSAKHLKIAQKTPIDIDKVIGEIKGEYDNAVNSLENENIKLQISEAAVTIKVTNTFSGGPDLQVLIFKASHRKKISKSSSLTFDLKLAKPSPKITPGLSIQPLTTFIIAAAEKFDQLSEKPIGDLQKDNFEIDLAFVIEKDKSGSISVIPTSSFGISGEYDHAVEHDLKLVFAIAPKHS